VGWSAGITCHGRPPTTVILVDLIQIVHRKSARKPGAVKEDSSRTRLDKLFARIVALEAELAMPMNMQVDSARSTNGSETEVIG
jgi:hypothetical protein